MGLTLFINILIFLQEKQGIHIGIKYDFMAVKYICIEVNFTSLKGCELRIYYCLPFYFLYDKQSKATER